MFTMRLRPTGCGSLHRIGIVALTLMLSDSAWASSARVDLSSLIILGQASSRDFVSGLKSLLDLIMLVGFVSGTAMLIVGIYESRGGDEIGLKHMIKGALIAGASAFMYAVFSFFKVPVVF